jgi:NAD(P)-dependent dehydrogenase (short-subunit alcohol dehydrogenase family)
MIVNDKVAVITGAASGIGLETAHRYAEHGASVVAVDVDEARGEETVRSITDDGGEARFVSGDITKPADLETAVETAVDTYGGLDVMVNNAGILGRNAEAMEFSIEEFREVVDVNLVGTFNGIKHAVPAMLADGGGSIVNTSSVASKVGHPGRCAYSASKAGINGLMRATAVEYAGDGIRVNSVLPGIVKTEMHRQAASQEDDSDRVSVPVSEPMSDTEQPGDIADAILFLGSDMAKRITGVELPVDGGLLASP